MSNVSIKAEGIGKRYLIGKKRDSSLRSTLTGIFRGSHQTDEFWALKDLDFEIRQGDVVGIIGKNGAGKSTLLKILSQITRPTAGKITLNGRVASLLEVGTGFHPELTGRENIYLNGTILGMTRKEVKSRFDEIVDFSGIEKFIDTPVKHYSSGMYVRLGFAVAAHLEPEILIIDEVLAVGDAEFQKKCLGKMNDVAKQGRTVLFVSHQMAAIKSLCTKGILIKEGRLSYSGDVGSALKIYNTTVLQSRDFYDFSDHSQRRRGQKLLTINSVKMEAVELTPLSTLSLDITLQDNSGFQGKTEMILFVFDDLNNTIFQCGTTSIEHYMDFNPDSVCRFEIKEIGLSPGNYRAGVWLAGNGIEQDYVEGIDFTIAHGSVYPNQVGLMTALYQKRFTFKETGK